MDTNKMIADHGWRSPTEKKGESLRPFKGRKRNRGFPRFRVNQDSGLLLKAIELTSR